MFGIDVSTREGSEMILAREDTKLMNNAILAEKEMIHHAAQAKRTLTPYFHIFQIHSSFEFYVLNFCNFTAHLSFTSLARTIVPAYFVCVLLLPCLCPVRL